MPRPARSSSPSRACSLDSVAFSPDGKRLAYGSNSWDDTKKTCAVRR